MKQLNHYETLEKMPKLNIDCILYICNISCENLGLILRSADIFGVTTIYYQGNDIDNHKQLSKLSRKSNVSLHLVSDIKSLVQLKKNGYELIALEITDTSIPLRTVSFQQKTCLIVGNEQNGVPENILEIADYACHIEMIGEHISSLNVSIATSIALYEITRRCLES